MRTFTRELTKERYMELMEMEREGAIWSECGPSLCLGYGVYGFKLYEENGGYFVDITCGTSCD